MRSNQGTLIHQKPLVASGQKVGAGDVLADGSSTDRGEMALGKNLMVAFMSWEGYNFEDAIILSKRLVRDDELTSIHIEEYEIDARTTKLGDEEITRDIPNRSEESLRNLDDRGIVRVGAEVGSGDLLVGKVTPKGETELTAEEKLIRAIFKEKAREVRDTSLKVPHGEGGVVIDVMIFSRDKGDDLPPGVNDLVRVFVAKKRKISEGDKLAGRHGNKGVISKIVDEQDMPFLEDGTPGRRDPQPARRAEPHERRPDPRDAPRLGRGAGLVRRRLRGLQARPTRRARNGRVYVVDARSSTARRSPTSTTRSSAGRTITRARSRWTSTARAARASRPRGKVTLYNGRTGEPFEEQITVGYMYILKLLHLVDDKIHARSTGPVLARHPAAARRQGAVRRPALRRDGGLGARGLRRRVHAPGDADDQVRRHGRAREGLRGDRQGREHRRAVDPRVLQGAAEGDAVAGARRQRRLRGGPARRDARRGRRPAARRRGARHRPLAACASTEDAAGRRGCAGRGRGADGDADDEDDGGGEDRRARSTISTTMPTLDAGRAAGRARRRGLARRARGSSRPRCAGRAIESHLHEDAVRIDEETA